MLIRAALIVLAAYLTGYWVAGLAVAVLLFIWELAPRGEGPPVLALALTYQWMQVTIGIFYMALTGQEVEVIGAGNTVVDWQPMVLVGLAWISCLTVGLFYGAGLVRRKFVPAAEAPLRAFSSKILYGAYAASLVLTGVVQELAWNFPAFTQAILAITFSHLALMFLLVRRFTRPTLRWQNLAVLMAIEIAMGFTGYFAGFREPLTMCAIAVFEVFDRRDVRHWAFIGVLGAVLLTSSLIWMTVRGQLRQEIDDEVVTSSRAERFDRARTVSSGLFSEGATDYQTALTALVGRLWAVQYPAMAMARVPDIVPHTDGQIMNDALVHLVTPRFLFPDKPDLVSDSELVRKYAGAQVAGLESNTSIAFGYCAESYVDYGIPLMFVPIIIWGLLMGAAYQMWLSLIHHRDLAIGLVTVIFWLGLYIFERSWAKTLGTTLTMMVYLGGLVYLVDQWLLMRRANQLVTGLVDHVIDSTS